MKVLATEDCFFSQVGSQFSFEVVFELAFAKVITRIMYSCEYNRASKQLHLKQKTVLTSKLLRTEKSIAP